MIKDIDFDISFNHDYDYIYNSSKSLFELKQDLLNLYDEIESVLNLITFPRILLIFLGISVLLMFIKACEYHYKFLNEIQYKNFIINEDFKIYEKMCFDQTKHKILPLRNEERSQYFELNWKFSIYNFKNLIPKSLFNILLSFLIWIICSIDESLYITLKAFQDFIKILFDGFMKVDKLCKNFFKLFMFYF